MGPPVTPLAPLPVRPARQVLLERLMEAGTWVSPDELVESVSTCRPAVEDAVADLVIEGKAEYREHVGYRLAGSVLQRRAAKLMREQRTRRHAYGEKAGNEYRLAVVRQVPADARGLDLVMYELSVPMPEDPTESLKAQQRLAQTVADRFFEEVN